MKDAGLDILPLLAEGNASLPIPQPPETLLTLSLIKVRQISSLDNTRPNTPDLQEQSLVQAQVQTQQTVNDKSVEDLGHYQDLKQIGMAPEPIYARCR